MKLTQYALAFFLAASLLACGNNSSDATQRTEQVEEAPPTSVLTQKEDQLWDEVMELHDDVMPKMTAMNRLSKQLKEAAAAEQIPAADTAFVSKTVADLAAADEGMWDWMHNLVQLDRLRQEKKHEEIIKYLQDEKVAIAKVRTDMLNGISTAENLVEKLELTKE
ncbi:MAG: hypothetical protein AAF798_12890 [Bacteroidota bacterium]